MVSPLEKSVIFISYAHKDDEQFKFLYRFIAHLESSRTLQKYNVEAWSDNRIKVGEEWSEEIEQAIDAAKVAVLFLSVDFLNSDFILRKELPRILENVKANKTFIVPVIFSPCSAKDLPDEIKQFQWFKDKTHYDDPSKMTISELEFPQKEWIWNKLKERIEEFIDHEPDPDRVGNPAPEELREKTPSMPIGELAEFVPQPPRRGTNIPYDPEDPPRHPAQPRLSLGGKAKRLKEIRAWNRTGRPLRLWCYVKSRGKNEAAEEYTHWLFWDLKSDLNNQKSLKDDLVAGWSFIVIEDLDESVQRLDAPEPFREGWYFFKPQGSYRVKIPGDYFERARQGRRLPRIEVSEDSGPGGLDD